MRYTNPRTHSLTHSVCAETDQPSLRPDKVGGLVTDLRRLNGLCLQQTLVGPSSGSLVSFNNLQPDTGWSCNARKRQTCCNGSVHNVVCLCNFQLLSVLNYCMQRQNDESFYAASIFYPIKTKQDMVDLRAAADICLSLPGADVHLYDIIKVESAPFLDVVWESCTEHSTTNVLWVARLVDRGKLTTHRKHHLY